MASTLNKLKLLFWKNWLLQWRHKWQTLSEILIPILLACILILIRGLSDPKPYDEVTKYPQVGLFKVTTLPRQIFCLAWSPEHLELTSYFEYVKKRIPIAKFIAQKDAKALEQYLALETRCIGIEFPDDYKTTGLNSTENVKMAIRYPPEPLGTLINFSWYTNLLFPLFSLPGPRNKIDDDGGYPPGYNREGFLTIQHQLTLSLIDFKRSESKKLPEIFMNRYPYPKYMDDPLSVIFQSIVPVIFMLSFIYTNVSIVKVVTLEKEKQIKESLKIMGLANWMHWLSWFVKCLSFLFITIVVITVLVKIDWTSSYAVFTWSSPFVIFLLLFFYVCAIISFAFMISVFFSKANTAATTANLLFILSMVPFWIYQNQYENLSYFSKIVMCLCHNTAMSFGFYLIMMKESSGEGMNLNNMFASNNIMDSFGLIDAIVMLIIDSIVYLLIALYVEQLYPGEYGIPKPWYFPFTKSFWGLETSNTYTSPLQNIHKPAYETEPELKVGVEIQNLFKYYEKEKAAVEDLSLNIYEDQITVLLGHNGAGKTTTMGILVGMVTPSSGEVKVYGQSIRENMSRIREGLGLCPQHNILFDDLTVWEHLYFFGKLKGKSDNEVKSEIDKYLTLLNLDDKRNSFSASLSGGMKRKLSVGIALCGDSKVVMLDEPTSGMDPSARRALWDILKSEKKGRVILLTTHFMDEADLLGDRVAIMSHGRLQCCGSPFFLKKHFGTGYNLIMDKQIKCKVNDVTDLLTKYVTDVELKSDIGSELTYTLDERNVDKFEMMLDDLERNIDNLRINSYGISLTTMEDVFFRFGSGSVDHTLENIQDNGSTRIKINSMPKVKLLEGTPLFINQLQTLLMKKMLYTMRQWRLLLIQLAIPAILLMFAFIILNANKHGSNLPELPITLKSYPKCVSVYNDFTKDASAQKLVKFYDAINRESCEVDAIASGDMEDFILKTFSSQTTGFVRKHYITGASFYPTKIVAWFNNDAYHATPLTINLIDNALLKFALNERHSIQVTNKPLPYSLQKQINENYDPLNLQPSSNIASAMAFVTAFFLLFITRERATRSKHLQFVTGGKILPFWISSYVWDFVNFVAVVIVMLIVFVGYQQPGYRTFDELARLSSFFLVFGLAMLPEMYIFSFIFEQPSNAYSRMVLVNLFFGCVAPIIIVVFAAPGIDHNQISTALDWIFLMIPHYALAMAVQQISKINTLTAKYNEICDLYSLHGDVCRKFVCDFGSGFATFCPDTIKSGFLGWEAPGSLRNLVFMIASIFVSFAILFAIEFHVFDPIMKKIEEKKRKPYLPVATVRHIDDDDVLNEHNFVEQLHAEQIAQFALVTKDLAKVYANNFVAVKGVSVAVNSNDCFGLLGVNGAGKTTTFKMLTGDVFMTSGEAWVTGLNIAEEMSTVRRRIGYCPQFDALLDELTVRETLHMFCLLRGIDHKHKEVFSEYLANELDFYAHYHKLIRQLSGGNKRKVSTAIAILNSPAVIYLDEPTTGMDPVTKRHLWNFICKIRDDGHCVVLTSHSMEECEALCTKIAIMVNGVFKCLGSVQHLKNKFAAGFTLTIKVNDQTNDTIEQDVQMAKAFVQTNFIKALLREEYNGLLTYYIKDEDKTWAQMFGIMQRAKREVDWIGDYSLGQSSLEQVFLTFTRDQSPHDK